ncbi:hypothetical protein BDV18DRAFT_4882 [Aspergillus unguis]
METAASVIAVVQISTTVILACNKYLRNVRHAQDEIQRLKDGIEAYLQTMQKLRELIDRNKGDRLEALASLRGLIDKSEVALKGIEMRLTGKENSPMRRLGLRALKWPFTKQEVDEALRNLGQWRNTLSMALLTDHFSQSLETAQSVDRTERNRYLNNLPQVVDAEFDSRSQQHDPHCLPGTRTEVLQRLLAWSNNHDSETIYWLRGMAGTGKSTIARTFASQLKDHLAGSFFFSRGGGDRGHAGKLITTLATQLARKDSELRRNICEAVVEDENIAQRSLAEQFRRLIVNPVNKLAGTSTTLVFVIDALDECDREEDIEIIPQLLSTLVNLKSKFRLRVLITGRPERAVRHGFLEIKRHFRHEFDLFDMDEAIVKQDISLMIDEELKKVRLRHGLPDSWPTCQSAVVDTLSDQAGSLFIYAKTVCRFILESAIPQRALKVVIEDSAPNDQSPTAQLDKMYLKLLQQSYVGDPFLFKTIVGSIVLTRTQLSSVTLCGLLNIDESTVSSVLHNLHSVLHVPADKCDVIQILHPSLRDFLLDSGRCTDANFQLQAQEIHRFLAYNSMRVMQRCLRADVCRLEIPGFSMDYVEKLTVAKSIRAETAYACLNWIYHICEAADTDVSAVERFLSSRLLHWIEALACLGEVHSGIYLIQALRDTEFVKTNRLLQQSLYDVYRYLMQHRPNIEQYPLQIYHSAALFSPKESFTSREFLGLLKNAVAQSGPIPATWSAHLQTWEGLSDPVVSPSGATAACIADFEHVELRETATGRCISTLDIGCGFFLAMSFSPDESMLIIATEESAIIWNVRLGSSAHLNRQGSYVHHAAFGDNGRTAVTSHSNGSVIVWDVLTGTCICALVGHTERVSHAEFSTDGKLILSASSDGTVRIWNSKTGALVCTLTGHIGGVDHARFMNNDKRVVSSSLDLTVRVWDAVLGTCLGVLTDCASSNPMNIAISPDRKAFACLKANNSIEIWDSATPACLMTLHDEPYFGFSSMEFSADNEVLLTRSMGARLKSMVRIWEISSGKLRRKFQGAGVSVGFLTKDQNRIWQVDEQGISVWQCSTYSIEDNTYSPGSGLKVVKWCSGCRFVATVDSYDNLTIWDVSACSAKKRLAAGKTQELFMSSDGRILAAVNIDCEIRLFDTNTQNWSHISTQSTENLTLSPDGNYVAYSGQKNVYVHLTETADSVVVRALAQDASGLVFSPCSGYLAILGVDGMVQMCPILTNNVNQALSGLRSTWLKGLPTPGLVVLVLDGQMHVVDGHTLSSLSIIKDSLAPMVQIQCTSDNNAILMLESKRLRVWSLRTGHYDSIVASSLDSGTELVTAPTAGFAIQLQPYFEVNKWNTKTGSLASSCLEGVAVECCAFDGAGTQIAAACTDRTLKFVKVGSSQWRTVGELTEKARFIDFSPNGRRIVVNTKDDNLQIWDVSGGCCLATGTGILEDNLDCDPFSPDGSRIAARLRENRSVVIILSTDNAAIVRTLHGHSTPVISSKWSPDGIILASTSDDRDLRLWDINSGTCVHRIRDVLSPQIQNFSPNGELFSYHSTTDKLVILESASRKRISSYSVIGRRLMDICFLPNNEPLALIKRQATLEVWKVDDGQRLGAISSIATNATFSPDGTLVSVDDYVWDYREGQLHLIPPVMFNCTGGWLEHQESPVLVSTQRGNSLEVLNTQTGTSHVLSKNVGKVTRSETACLHGSGLIAYCDSGSANLSIWDVYQECLHAIYFSNLKTGLVQFSGDGTVVMGVIGGNRLLSCSIGTGVQVTPFGPFQGFQDAIDLCISHTAKVIAAIDVKNHIVIWDMQRGEPIATLRGHDDWVRQPFFSEKHSLVAAISSNNTVQVWDWSIQRLVAYFAYTKQLYGVTITEDGKSLLVNDGWAETSVLIADGTPPAVAYYWISVEYDWIMWKEHKIIYIPPEYQTQLSNINDNIVMLVPRSGDPMFIHLDRDLDPTKWSFEDPLDKNPDLWITEESLADYLGEY